MFSYLTEKSNVIVLLSYFPDGKIIKQKHVVLDVIHISTNSIIFF